MSSTQNTSASATPQLASAPAVVAAEPAVEYSPTGPDPEALRNLIVNFLPPMMNEAQLWQLFGQFGPIESVKIIYDRETHQSRSYGFVKFQFFFSAAYAVSCLDRFELVGKILKVAYANVDAAKKAFDVVKQSLTEFNPQQKMALQEVYYHQLMTAQEGDGDNYGNRFRGAY